MAKKLTTNSNLLIFANTKIPPKIIRGSVKTLPIHQEAPVLKNTALKKTAIAVGLKMCFFLIAKIYFETIEVIPTKERLNTLLKKSDGPTISVRIRADIVADSKLTFALNSFEKK